MFLPLRGAEGPVPYWLFCARVAPDGLVPVPPTALQGPSGATLGADRLSLDLPALPVPPRRYEAVRRHPGRGSALPRPPALRSLHGATRPSGATLGADRLSLDLPALAPWEGPGGREVEGEPIRAQGGA